MFSNATGSPTLNTTRNATDTSNPTIDGDYYYAVIRTGQAGLAFVLNAMFLVVLATNRDLVKQKRITYHVANLAIADAGYGLFRFSYYCLVIVEGHSLKDIFQIIATAGYLSSFLAVALMTMERAVVIRHPLKWPYILPPKRTFLLGIGTWLLALGFAVAMYLFPTRVVLIICNGLATVIVSSTAAVNIYIFKVLQKEKKSPATISNNQEKANRLKQKACVLVLMLTTIMVVTCLPALLCATILFAYWHVTNSYTTVLARVFYYCRLVGALNFVVNPVIYIWKVRVYRKAFLRTFRINKCFGEN